MDRPVGMRGSWFLTWALVGAVATIGTLVLGTIGLAGSALIVWVVSRRSRRLADVLGAVAGCGASFVLIAFLNRDAWGCVAPAACGGTRPEPWLVAGLVLIALSFVARVAVARVRLRSRR